MKKTLKHTLSLVLALMMVVSTMAISVVTTSAASKTTYTLSVNTGGSNATSIDIMEVTVLGTNGETDTHTMYCMATKEGTKTVTFEDAVDVGEITGIRIKNIGIDDWYPNYITISTPSDTETIYGGRWIADNKTVTLKDTDNVFKLEIKTGTETGAGTDDTVKITLKDANGRTATLLSADDIHTRTNAFEKGDCETIYMSAPDNFGQLKSISIVLSSAGILTPGGDWYIENIYAKQVSGTYEGYSGNYLTNTWIDG